METTARRLMLFAYLCSGFAGLVYQVTWTRLMVLHVGSTTAAVTTVVAAFMGGLAGGAAIAATLAPRLSRARAFAVYAGLEVGAAVSALMLPVALAVVQPLLSWAYQSDGAGFAFSLIRTTTCLAAVAVPALLLGGTFPIALRSLTSFRGDEGASAVSAGWLYAVNTTGAACGALAAGFVLLPLLGLRRTVVIGAAASLAAAATAWLARTQLQAGESDATVNADATLKGLRHKRGAESRHNRKGSPADRKGSSVVPEMAFTIADMWAAAVVVVATGFAGLLYEVSWTRAIASLLGPTTYAFAGVVFVLIAGLAVGSGIGSSRWLRAVRPDLALSAILAATALVVWWGNAALGTRVPEGLARTFAASPSDPGWPLLLGMVSALAPLVPAAIGLGASFPLALRLAGTQATAPRRIGVLYALNTAAGVLGTLISGKLLVAIGLESALRVVPAALLAAAAVSMMLSARSKPVVASVASAALIALALFLSTSPLVWDRELLASGIYKYARTIPAGVDLEAVLKAATLLDYRDGEHATVSVIEFAGTRSLAIDGKVDGSTGGDMLNQELAAHLPLLLHERPRDVLVIGLGTGVTLGAAAAHPADRIDIVEISPEVVRASAWFREQNGGALSDPRVHLIVGDARSHLTMTNRAYDVIVSEPSNPWIAGVAALFTQEAFSAIKSRLAPGGIACQWVHTYDISEGDLRSIIGTFAAVFPNGTIWMAGEGDLLLVSSKEPLDTRLASITDSWKRPGVVADLKRVGVLAPFGVLSLWGGGPRTIASIGAGVPLQTDDRMALEFSGPLAVYRTAGSSQVGLVRQLQTSTDVPALIERARAGAGAAEWRDRAAMLRKIHAFDAAYTDYAHAFSLGLFDDLTVSGLAQTAIPAGTVDDAVGRLTAALQIAPSSSVLRVALSKLQASVGQRDAALATAQAPEGKGGPEGKAGNDGKGGDQVAILEQLAALYADSGDAASLARVVEQLQALRPEGTRTRYYAAAVRFMQGAFADALAKAKLASDADTDPSDIDPLNLTGDALASMGRFDEAQTAFEAALKRAPADPTIYVNLGLVALSKGDASRAEKRFAAALTLDPTFKPAADGLAQAKQNLASRPKKGRATPV